MSGLLFQSRNGGQGFFPILVRRPYLQRIAEQLVKGVVDRVVGRALFILALPGYAGPYGAGRVVLEAVHVEDHVVRMELEADGE